MTETNAVSYFKSEALTDMDLRVGASSIFATAPMSGLSARYRFVPTSEIVTGLRDKGWLPVKVEQQRVRLAERFGFQKHLLRFRLASQMASVDEWNTELVLTNSHDAGCAYILQVGIYRRLCSNGLVVSDQGFEAIRFRHSGLKAKDVVEASYEIFEHVPKIGASIERFRNRRLSAEESLTFAQQALALRYGTLDRSPIEPQTLLTVRRAEDQSNDLWTTFNCCQENLIRGGLSDNRRDRAGKLRSMRALNGIDSKVFLNKALWNLADLTASHVN